MLRLEFQRRCNAFMRPFLKLAISRRSFFRLINSTRSLQVCQGGGGKIGHVKDTAFVGRKPQTNVARPWNPFSALWDRDPSSAIPRIYLRQRWKRSTRNFYSKGISICHFIYLFILFWFVVFIFFLELVSKRIWYSLIIWFFNYILNKRL